MTVMLEITEQEHQKLRRLLDRAGDMLRELGPDDPDAQSVADGCDHWLEIVETLGQ